MFQRISVNPDVCHGQPCIKGTRFSVSQIILMLANSDSIEDLLEAYPTITREDILECLSYAAYVIQEQIIPIEE